MSSVARRHTLLAVRPVRLPVSRAWVLGLAAFLVLSVLDAVTTVYDHTLPYAIERNPLPAWLLARDWYAVYVAGKLVIGTGLVAALLHVVYRFPARRLAWGLLGLVLLVIGFAVASNSVLVLYFWRFHTLPH